MYNFFKFLYVSIVLLSVSGLYAQEKEQLPEASSLGEVAKDTTSEENTGEKTSEAKVEEKLSSAEEKVSEKKKEEKIEDEAEELEEDLEDEKLEDEKLNNDGDSGFSRGEEKYSLPIVKKITIEYIGAESVSERVIRSMMRTSVGHRYIPYVIEEDLRRLYETGFFKNLRISDKPYKGGGVEVVVIAQTKPLIEGVFIEGEKRIKEKRLLNEIKSKVNTATSEERIFKDTQKLEELYMNKGFYDAKVRHRIARSKKTGRTLLTFIVNEGDRSYVREITFEGNKEIPTAELKKVMKTRGKNWLSFMNKSGLYKTEQVAQDLVALKGYYQNKGFIDARVGTPKLKKTGKERMILVIPIKEGNRYQVSKVSVQGNRVVKDAEINKGLKMKKGATYSAEKINQDIVFMTDSYGKLGYIDADVLVEKRVQGGGRVAIYYTINEGAKSFVDRVIIQGNSKTKDKVIRRELAVLPGEEYDSVNVEASKARLQNLGFFDSVTVVPQNSGTPDRKNMVVSVREKRTGEIRFGAGFSSIDSLVGFVELSQGNFDFFNPPSFIGGGQKFRAKIQYGLSNSNFLFSLSEPWFLDKKLLLGFDLFGSESKYLSSRYNQQNLGGAIRIAKPLNDFWTISAKYQLELIKLYDFDSESSTALLREKGTRTKSGIEATLSYDTRDNVFLTRKGERIVFTAEYAGGAFYGQTNIYRFQVDAQKYFHLPWDMILMIGGSTGFADSFGDSEFVPIFDRLFVGGPRSVRGFDYRDVGPLDDQGEPTGGRTYAYINAELTFPILKDRVRGAVFYDVGFVDSRFAKYDRFAEDSNASVGVGFRLNLPIGPLRLDYGFPIKYSEHNKSDGRFSIDVGYQF